MIGLTSSAKCYPRSGVARGPFPHTGRCEARLPRGDFAAGQALERAAVGDESPGLVTLVGVAANLGTVIEPEHQNPARRLSKGSRVC